MINSVVIAGRLSREPEVTTTPTGKLIAKISVAVNQHKERVHFFDATCWEKQAEYIERFGTKGSKITVQGYLTQERWKDPSSGSPRSKIIIVSTSVYIPLEQKEETTPTGNEYDPFAEG